MVPLQYGGLFSQKFTIQLVKYANIYPRHTAKKPS